MATLRLRDFLGPVVLAPPAPIGAGGQTLVVDRLGWDTVQLLIALGASTAPLAPTTAEFTPVVKVSESLAGPFEAPPAADLDYPLPTLDDSDLLVPYLVEYTGTARYMLLEWDDWVGSQQVQACVVALRGGPRKILAGAVGTGLAAL